MRPHRDEVHIWLREVPGADARSDGDPLVLGGEREAEAVLDAGERERAGRFFRAVDRERYTAAHLMLRRVLGGYLGLPPGQVALTREPCPCCGAPHGRPAPADPSTGLHFSLSHAGPLVLLAVAERAVGADVEALPAPGSVADLATVLHPAERAELAEAEGTDRLPQEFARLWTRKEAYLKGIGTGLGRGPELDYVGSRQPGPVGWTLTDLEMPPGFAAAVALSLEASGGDAPALVQR